MEVYCWCVVTFMLCGVYAAHLFLAHLRTCVWSASKRLTGDTVRTSPEAAPYGCGVLIDLASNAAVYMFSAGSQPWKELSYACVCFHGVCTLNSCNEGIQLLSLRPAAAMQASAISRLGCDSMRLGSLSTHHTGSSPE
jgi:hypothetical protein